MMNKTLYKRLEAIEQAGTIRHSSCFLNESVEDSLRMQRRYNRMNAVLTAIYAKEGMTGLQERHEAALAKGKHRIPKWLAGHPKATEYSYFMHRLQFNINRMNQFCDLCKHVAAGDDDLLDVARKGDILAFEAFKRTCYDT